MLDQGVACLTDKNKISSKLKWQPTSGKDKETSKKFLNNVLQVRGFNAFLFMRKDSSIVKMAHSVVKFATINPILQTTWMEKYLPLLATDTPIRNHEQF